METSRSKELLNKGLFGPSFSELHHVSHHGDYTVSVDSKHPLVTGTYLHYKGTEVGRLNYAGRLTGANGEKYKRIAMAYIHPDHRGQGHGTRMYQAALQHLSDGCAGIGSKVVGQWNDEQIPAIYKRLGARHEVSPRKNQFLIDKPKPVKPAFVTPTVVKPAASMSNTRETVWVSQVYHYHNLAPRFGQQM